MSIYKKFLVSLVTFAAFSTAWGASLTFNGGDWNDTANWTGGVVATSADDVTTAANVASNSGAPAVVRTLTVQGNGVLNIDLTASDGATFNGYA
ncbi:hypothetical protein KA057_03530, partial [Candidatus Gracilibacteria bacterium]|nr:hypothetical protein [Candidatus Gracilibacteria bacterium]